MARDSRHADTNGHRRAVQTRDGRAPLIVAVLPAASEADAVAAELADARRATCASRRSSPGAVAAHCPADFATPIAASLERDAA